ncbi:hypothetical protein JG688_00018537 [Phytophthora aleatoria]|uniref:Uncharacterized protein n=1 Tax=Phytophthora aleatoria TaxID=2496075 RepID=A0A8J5LXL9_9STRA|nr:hypothetical protein JG688_00018537 [Phytophthora aleatoria]
MKIENQLRQVRVIELPRDSDVQVLRNIFPTFENLIQLWSGCKIKMPPWHQLGVHSMSCWRTIRRLATT